MADTKKAKDTGGMAFFSYSGRGDAARKRAIEEQTEEAPKEPEDTPYNARWRNRPLTEQEK